MEVIAMPTPTPVRRGIDFSEIGRSGIKRFAGQVFEEFLPSLRGLQGIRVYREMRDNDSIVGACLYAIEQVIRQASWFVEPASESDKDDAKAAQFLGECIGDMSTSWNDFISEVLSFLPYGWAYHEKVYKLRKGTNNNPKLNSRFDDGLIGWRKLPLRLQITLFDWDFDETGGIRGMWQCPPPDYQQLYIPISKAILFRTRAEGNNPEGRALLRNSYRSWYFKKQLETIEAIGVERDLVGLPIITPPEGYDIMAKENAEMRTGIDKLISGLRRDEQEGVCLPFGWTLSLLSNGATRRQFDLDRIINRYDKRIAITMLAQFIMLGMERVGSFALSTNQNDLFLTAVQGILNTIAETINKFAVPQLFQLNPIFAVRMYPRLVPSKVSTPNLTELSNYINSLARAMLLPTDDAKLQRELMRIGGFSEASERKQGEIYIRNGKNRRSNINANK